MESLQCIPLKIDEQTITRVQSTKSLGVVFHQRLVCEAHVDNLCKRFSSGLRTSGQNDHITPVLKKLKWLPVKNYLYYRDATLAFKCMTGFAPNYLCNKFICRGDVSKRNTRNSQLLNIPLFKTTTGQRSFSYRVVDIWNNLPTDIKLCKNVAGFKIKLRKHLLNEFLVS